MATTFTLMDATFRSPRHTTHYWEAGSAGGALMIFASPSLQILGGTSSRLSSRPVSSSYQLCFPLGMYGAVASLAKQRSTL
jgi:hypothetical protein